MIVRHGSKFQPASKSQTAPAPHTSSFLDLSCGGCCRQVQPAFSCCRTAPHRPVLHHTASSRTKPHRPAPHRIVPQCPAPHRNALPGLPHLDVHDTNRNCVLTAGKLSPRPIAPQSVGGERPPHAATRPNRSTAVALQPGRVYPPAGQACVRLACPAGARLAAELHGYLPPHAVELAVEGGTP